MNFFSILRHKHLTNTIAITLLTLVSPLSAHALAVPSELIPEKPSVEAKKTTHGYLSGTVVAAASPITELVAPVPAPRAKRSTFRGESPEKLVMEGIASYYSKAGCLGCNPLFVMANGQVLDDNALTMAIGADKKHLVGYRARVTNLATGKSVVVLITDTGGFYKDKYGNRVADLTIGTKTAIGMKGGLGRVRVEVL